MEEDMVWAVWAFKGPQEWSIDLVSSREAEEMDANETFTSFSAAKRWMSECTMDAIKAYQWDMKCIRGLTKKEVLSRKR